MFTPPTDKVEVRRQLGWRKSDVIAIYVGGLVTSKGVRDLAAACDPLLRQDENFRLVCIGDGPAWDALVGLGNVHSPGRVSPGEVPLLLQGSDFMVLPSHSEGMPQAVLEAMGCGLPVVATKVGGVPEAVVDGETGLLVKARDVEGLRGAIERMITDVPFRHAAGQAGLERARTVFDSERNAKVLADALKSVVEPQRVAVQNS
jgi:glycosyltransferase involved in cell wall biosynthesis